MKKEEKLMELIGQVSPALIDKTLPKTEQDLSADPLRTDLPAADPQPAEHRGISILRISLAAAVTGLFVAAGVILLSHMNKVRSQEIIPGAAVISDTEPAASVTTEISAESAAYVTGTTAISSNGRRTESISQVEVIYLHPDNTGCTLKMRNTTNNEMNYGPEFHIEKDGKNLSEGMELPWPCWVTTLQPGEEESLYLDWSGMYGSLEPGQYEIHLESGDSQQFPPVPLVIPEPSGTVTGITSANQNELTTNTTMTIPIRKTVPADELSAVADPPDSFSDSELNACLQAITEEMQNGMEIVSAYVSQKMNRVVLTCEDAEKEARVKSQLAERCFNMEMIVFGANEKPPTVMSKSPAVEVVSVTETPDDAENASELCKVMLKKVYQHVYLKKPQYALDWSSVTYPDWQNYFLNKTEWEYHCAGQPVKSCTVKSVTQRTESFDMNKVFVEINTECEIAGISTARNDTHWFVVEMLGKSYRIIDWYMPGSEFDREVRGVLTKQDFMDAENAPLQSKYLLKQRTLLKPYSETRYPALDQYETARPVELIAVTPDRTGCTLVIRNLTDRNSGYTPRLRIEKDGKELPYIRENAGWEETWVELNTGMEHSAFFNWENIYGALEIGTYTLYLDAESFRDYPVEFSIPFP